MDHTNRELFSSIQEFCSIELKIQIIPIDSVSNIAQYLERHVKIKIRNTTIFM